MLVDELRMAVTAQQDAEIVEGRNDARQLYAIDQKDCERNLLLANSIEK